MRRVTTTLLAALVLGGVGLTATGCGAAPGESSDRSAAPKADRVAEVQLVAKGGADDCAATWGSMAKTAPDGVYHSLVNIRTGRHDCYDRMVLDVPGASTTEPIGYRVQYVSEVRQQGSGDPVPVSGGAILEIIAAAPAYDPETGEPTYEAGAGAALPGVNLTGYQTFRDARLAGSFEGQTQIGLGVRARLPFRVFQTGDRLVIDVAHSWPASS